MVVNVTCGAAREAAVGDAARRAALRAFPPPRSTREACDVPLFWLRPNTLPTAYLT